MTLKAIDLFAGAGGLSIGATMAGADVRLAVDLDPFSCQTLRENPVWHKGRVLEADVSTLSGQDLRELAGVSAGDSLLVIGGAPCQPFSKAAYWVDPGDDALYRRARARGEQTARPTSPPPVRPDERRNLVDEFWRIVRESHADAFVFENVPSLLHPRHRPILDGLIAKARRDGFRLTLATANAAEFGVAQRRHRIFLLAARGTRPAAPEPSHTLEPRTGFLPAVTAAEAFAKISYELLEDEPGVVVTGRWADHLREIPPGWNYKHHTAWAGHVNPTFETETRFWSFLLKLNPDLPSWTIPANPGPWVGPFHWTSRRLMTAELAALQAFPPGFAFAGNRRERVRQIGNAVPPLLASRMIAQVVKAVGAGHSRRDDGAEVAV